MTQEPHHFCDEALEEAKSGNGEALVVKEERNAVEAYPVWPDVHEKTGAPLKTYRNARAAIQALRITCRHDRFHDRKLIGGHAIGMLAGQLSDEACCVLRQVIIDTYDFDPGKDNVNDFAVELCIENSFDPVVDYLDGLKWDGVDRLDAWVVAYLGAADTPLNRMIGKLTLVAAVRRARQPGCKFDHMTVLEGPEGKMKSTAILVLAGEENFSDQTILAVGDREQQELVAGVWFYGYTRASRNEEGRDREDQGVRHQDARPCPGSLSAPPHRCASHEAATAEAAGMPLVLPEEL